MKKTPIPSYLSKVPEEEAYILRTLPFDTFRSFVGRWEIATQRTEILDAAREFLTWFVGYADAILAGRTYQRDGVVTALFRLGQRTPHQHREFLRMSICASRAYVAELHGMIDIGNIERYKHTLLSLGIDLEELILECEVHLRKSIPAYYLQAGRRMDLSPTDLWFTARSVFWIEEREKIEELYLRDLKPVVIFQIRQLMEMYGKAMLGYDEIRNRDGTINKRMTHEAWKFIAREVKKPVPKITLPFNADSVIHISDWANSFVHTTFLYSSYIQFYALEVLTLLFTPAPVAIKTYDGRVRRMVGVAQIEIRDYLGLKRAFETWLREKVRGVEVVWLDPSKVGAYILDMGTAPAGKLPFWKRWLKRIFPAQARMFC